MMFFYKDEDASNLADLTEGCDAGTTNSYMFCAFVP